ncbi:MAG: EFR1 family ferrodoxin, partial [Clostridia bacterium]|nr:EFR1 family ferrodoxin [Clostridia bacterium]
NTSCRVGLCQALEEKGFNVTYEKMMVMPSNWVVQVNDHLAVWLLKVIPEKVSRITDSIVSGKILRVPKRRSALQRLITRMEKSGSHVFAKDIKISDACKGCGWCERHCPVANITMSNGRPAFKEGCVMCFRCIYGCPQKAMSHKSFMVLKSGFDLDALEKRMRGVELMPVKKCCRGMLLLGVARYLNDRDGF